MGEIDKIEGYVSIAGGSLMLLNPFLAQSHQLT